MALIRLTTLNADGEAKPCYVDASRILVILPARMSIATEAARKRRHKLLIDLYDLSANLAEKAAGYVPDLTDPVAVAWFHNVRETANAVNVAYGKWQKAWEEGDYEPATDCTEVQLACGTALEHGVMLSRFYVSETPEHVAGLVGHQAAK